MHLIDIFNKTLNGLTETMYYLISGLATNCPCPSRMGSMVYDGLDWFCSRYCWVLIASIYRSNLRVSLGTNLVFMLSKCSFYKSKCHGYLDGCILQII